MKGLGLLCVLEMVPAAARACAVCFGGSSPDLARGFTWGVLILLLLPFVLMASLVGLIVYHIRKNKVSLSP
jgi:hypothetical protein